MFGKKKNQAAAFFAVFFLAGFLLPVISCNFIDSMTEGDEVDLSTGKMTLERSAITLDIGEMAAINLSCEKNQRIANISWRVEGDAISATFDNYGTVITALNPGTSIISASSSGYDTKCVVTVTTNEYKPKIENPYVYASEDVVNLATGEIKTIFASAYGGAPNNMGWTWTCDKPTIVQVTGEGNYCRIKGNAPGQAKITLRNSAVSSVPYSILVNVSSDGLNIPYITTESNVITVLLSQKENETFNVKIMNSSTGEADNGLFSYNVIDVDGKPLTEDEAPAKVIATGKTFKVEPLRTGICIVRVTHQEAPYPLDIILRVNTEASGSYITVDQKMITLSSELKAASVTATLVSPRPFNEDTSKYIWKASDNADLYVDYQINGGDNTKSGNVIIFTPKKNGVAKFTVTYPDETDSKASVTVVVKNMESEAANAKTYISTSQNYMKAYAGGDDLLVDVNVINMTAGGENDLYWEIDNQPSDGSTSDVIKWQSGTGRWGKKQRAAITPNTTGRAVIRPVKPGKAIIKISHPNAMYSTSITIKVDDKDAPKEKAPWYLSTDTQLLTLVADDGNGVPEEVIFNLLLTGEGVADADYNDIIWSCQNPNITLRKNLSTMTATYNGIGSGNTMITFSHPKTSQSVTLPVVFAENKTATEDIKSISSGSPQNQTLHVGETTNLFLTARNFNDTDYVSWTASTPEVLEVTSIDSQTNTVTVTARKKGFCIVKAKAVGIGEIDFYFNVKEDGKEDDYEEAYLSTVQNVLYFAQTGDETDITIDGINISNHGLLDIKWNIYEMTKDEEPKVDANGNRIKSSAYSIIPNGAMAKITAEEDETEAILSVTHPASENELLIPLRTGKQYDWKNDDFAYIDAETSFIEMKMGEGGVNISAVLAHTASSEVETTGFLFKADNNRILDVTSTTSSCYLTPKAAGSTTLIISHPFASNGLDLEIPVIIKDRDDPTRVPYITTQTNVVNITEGELGAVSVALVNKMNQNKSDWAWTIDDNSICEISVPSGNTVMLKGLKPGSTGITVRNIYADHPLHLVAVVSSGTKASIQPYIKTAKNIVTLAPKGTDTIAAEIVGGSGDSSSKFVYTSSDPTVAIAQGNGTACRITAVSQGTATITIENTKYPGTYPKTLLVVVKDTVAEGCEISIDYNKITLAPDPTSPQNVRAKLVGGTETDDMDFTWWLDDPTFADIRTAAGECQIIPTGKAGVTTLRVEHPKVLHPRTITLSFTRYTTFKFSQSSLKVTAGDVAFVSVEMPSDYKGADVRFTTNDRTLAIATGVGNVCMIQALENASGLAVISAGLYIDGERVAQAECSLSVVPYNHGSANITTASSMYLIEVGESRMITAQITGDMLPGNAADKMTWEIMTDLPDDKGGGKDGIWDYMGLDITQNAGLKAMGETANLVAREPGEYIVKVSYSDITGTETGRTYILINVPDRRDTAIILSNDSIVYYQGQSIEITAELWNAPQGAERYIRWSVEQSETNRILSISNFESASTGSKCAFSTLKTGTCVVRATYTNEAAGIKVTQACFVTVKGQGNISLGTTMITVYPGGKQKIPYTVEPEGTGVTWVAEYNTYGSLGGTMETPFSFIDHPNEGYIEITGGDKDCGKVSAGSIKGILNNISTTMVEVLVFVNYECELNIRDEQGSMDYVFLNPRNDTSDYLTLNYMCFPAELEVNWEEALRDAGLSDCIQIVSMTNTINPAGKNGREQKEGKIVLKPLCEFPYTEVKFEAKSEKDSNLHAQKTRAFMCRYDSYTFDVEWEFGSGAMSYYDQNTNTFHLGDGESVIGKIKIKEPLARPTNLKVRYIQPTQGIVNNIEYPHFIMGKYNDKKGLVTITGASESNNYIDLEPQPDGSYRFELNHTQDIYSNMVNDGKAAYTFLGGA